MAPTVVVDGRTLTAADVAAVAWHGARVVMAEEVMPRLARDRAVVALVGVFGPWLVGDRGGLRAREHVLPRVLCVGVLLDGFGELFDLGGDVFAVTLVVGAAGGLHQHLACAL